MGDAGEALVVSELTLAGVPAAKMPDNWPNYDVIAEPEGADHPQRVSVKTRTFRRSGDAYVEYHINDRFDWLAIVVLPNADEGESERRIFVFPKAISDARFHQSRDGAKYHDFKSLRVDKMKDVLREFENNFIMSATGIPSSN
jgi:hypothetical protein